MHYTLFLLLLLSSFSYKTQAQPLPERKASPAQIPGLFAIAASEFHLYALSETEGLVVFRNYADSLQFLYRSEGMQRRGRDLTADSRFAYLVHDSTLSVVEPTSMLGVYSSTKLPAKPSKLLRSGSSLFVVAGTPEVFKLNLESPDSFDRSPEIAYRLPAADRTLDLVSQGNSFILLSSEPAMFWLNRQNDSLTLARKISLDRNLKGLLILESSWAGYDESGNVYQIQSSGKTTPKGSIKEPVKSVTYWRDRSIIRGSQGSVWIYSAEGVLSLFRKAGPAGNAIASAKNKLWMAEFGTLSMYDWALAKQTPERTKRSVPKLAPVLDAIVAYPRPFLETIHLTDGNQDEIRFFVRSATAGGIRVEGNGLFWQPASRDVGRHAVTVIASHASGTADSVSFTIEVRPFNAPPRFAPILPLTIAATEKFELPLRASDPDGMNPDLIRYLGVDLPEGSVLNERTGLFTWTPAEKHIGNHSFRIIASDQFGAASAQEIKLVVQKTIR